LENKHKTAKKMENNPILRPKEVAELLGITVTTLNRYAKRPDFPGKISLSPRHTGYYKNEIIQYLDSFAKKPAKGV
jgi:predicted DNA-binding transcriptional regulator AlpA